MSGRNRWIRLPVPISDVFEDGVILDAKSASYLLPGARIKIGNKTTSVTKMASHGSNYFIGISNAAQYMRGAAVYVENN